MVSVCPACVIRVCPAKEHEHELEHEHEHEHGPKHETAMNPNPTLSYEPQTQLQPRAQSVRVPSKKKLKRTPDVTLCKLKYGPALCPANTHYSQALHRGI